MALREPRAIRPEHERHVGVARSREPEQVGEQDLSRRRVEQVGAAHDLADPLVRVIDDDGELVRGHPVRAAHDEVIDGAGTPPGETILELDHLAISSHPQRVGHPVSDPPPGLLRRERRTRPRIGPLRKRAVRRRCGFPDLGARAEARIQAAGALELRERFGVQLAALGLAHRLAVPVEPERAQVRELPRLPLPA